MSEDDANSNELPIVLTVAAVLLAVLLVGLVGWGNSIGYHPPNGHSKYNPGVGSWDPPKHEAQPPEDRHAPLVIPPPVTLRSKSPS